MKFDTLIQLIDMWHCHDQQQREALFGLVFFDCCWLRELRI